MREYWIALNNVSGLGPSRIKRLVEAFGTPKAALFAPLTLLIDKKLVPPQSAGGFREAERLIDAAREQIEACLRSGVSALIQSDDEYPMYLKEIFAPPPVLYVKGDSEALKSHAVAIVGTRGPTRYGVDCARSIAGELCQKAAIVSGLARGIDTAAHERCLELGGRTIAVLGCGIDRIYPSENEGLSERICEFGGALVSEFPIGAAPEPYNFPRRNRIISGLSCGVVVVEAGSKSGALITADYALQQNRIVFAVPGPITSPMSAGTFKLIKDGAVPVRSAADIFEHISEVTFAPTLAVPRAPLRSEAPPLLENEELAVWDALSGEPEQVDALSEACGMAIPQLLGVLLSLELKGVAAQVGGQQYRRAF